MTYTFNPSHPGAVAYAFQGGTLLRAGDVVEMTEAQASALCGIVLGANGQCLIPCDPAPVTAAAEFLAAISTPTVLNPETPAAAVSTHEVEPVKRKPGRPKKDPA